MKENRTTKEPILSVIVPVFNVDKYLQKCIDSILNQSLKDMEIILVDDGSADDSGKICDAYAKKDSRVFVIHKENQGLGMARNSGMEMARGNYITFVDSDDYVDAVAYERLVSLMVNNSLDAVYFGCWRFSDRLGVWDGGACSTDFKSAYGDSDIRSFMLDLIANPPERKIDRDIMVSSCMAIYKRSVLFNNNIQFYSERELISEDLIFNVHFLDKAERVQRVPEQYYYYRVNESSLTRILRFDRFAMCGVLYRYLQKYASEVEFEDSFKSEFIARCQRMTLGMCRSSIKIIVKSRQLKYWKKLAIVHKYLQSDFLSEIVTQYPYYKLPLKYRFFTFLMKRKWTALVCLMMLF